MRKTIELLYKVAGEILVKGFTENGNVYTIDTSVDVMDLVSSNNTNLTTELVNTIFEECYYVYSINVRIKPNLKSLQICNVIRDIINKYASDITDEIRSEVKEYKIDINKLRSEIIKVSLKYVSKHTDDFSSLVTKSIDTEVVDVEVVDVEVVKEETIEESILESVVIENDDTIFASIKDVTSKIIDFVSGSSDLVLDIVEEVKTLCEDMEKEVVDVVVEEIKEVVEEVVEAVTELRIVEAIEEVVEEIKEVVEEVKEVVAVEEVKETVVVEEVKEAVVVEEVKEVKNDIKVVDFNASSKSNKTSKETKKESKIKDKLVINQPSMETLRSLFVNAINAKLTGNVSESDSENKVINTVIESMFSLNGFEFNEEFAKISLNIIGNDKTFSSLYDFIISNNLHNAESVTEEILNTMFRGLLVEQNFLFDGIMNVATPGIKDIMKDSMPEVSEELFIKFVDRIHSQEVITDIRLYGIDVSNMELTYNEKVGRFTDYISAVVSNIIDSLSAQEVAKSDNVYVPEQVVANPTPAKLTPEEYVNKQKNIANPDMTKLLSAIDDTGKINDAVLYSDVSMYANKNMNAPFTDRTPLFNILGENIAIPYLTDASMYNLFFIPDLIRIVNTQQALENFNKSMRLAYDNIMNYLMTNNINNVGYGIMSFVDEFNFTLIPFDMITGAMINNNQVAVFHIQNGQFKY